MQLFEVIRWGNDSNNPMTGGANGADTCFLVRADSVEAAASLVDRELARTPSPLVAAWAGAVYLLGNDATPTGDARILRGPYIENAYRHGWRHWYREAPDDPWQERD
jgi:hypothetical protein